LSGTNHTTQRFWPAIEADGEGLSKRQHKLTEEREEEEERRRIILMGHRK